MKVSPIATPATAPVPPATAPVPPATGDSETETDFAGCVIGCDKAAPTVKQDDDSAAEAGQMDRHEDRWRFRCFVHSIGTATVASTRTS